MPLSFDDLELDLIMAAAASLEPGRRAAFLERIAAQLGHCQYCEEGALAPAVALAQQPMTSAA